MFECQHGMCDILHRIQTRGLCHPPYAVNHTKVLWSWLWLQSLDQQNRPCTPYHHQRHFRFSERLLGSNFPLTPVSSSSPSILKPRAGNFPELFNGWKYPVWGADQARLEPGYVPKKSMSFPNIASSECLPNLQAPTLLEGAQNKIKTGC